MTTTATQPYIRTGADFIDSLRGRDLTVYLLGEKVVESLHGAGSPQAQRVQIARAMQLEYRKHLARILAGIDDVSDSAAVAEDLTGYLGEVFRVRPANIASTFDAEIMSDLSAGDGDPAKAEIATTVEDV